MQSLLRLVPLLLLLAVPGHAADDEPKKPSTPTWYAQTLTRGEAGLNVSHFWSKGAMLRAETIVAGHKVVTIVRGEWYYAYDALEGSGLAIQREPAIVRADDPAKRPFGREYEILTSQGAELVRMEDLLGRKAGVYRITDELGKRELWVTEDEDRIPLRVEIYDRRTSARRTIDYVNWQSDLFIPDDFFAPDARMKLTELDHTEYLRRSSEEGSVGPVPVLYLDLLYERNTE
jgi:hypothetical protein